MNNIELLATRRALMCSVPIAAEYIGQVSERMWRYYESGEKEIPAHVSSMILHLVSNRNDDSKELVTIIALGLSSEDEVTKIPYFSTFQEFKNSRKDATELDYCLYQSSIFEVYTNFKYCTLSPACKKEEEE